MKQGQFFVHWAKKEMTVLAQPLVVCSDSLPHLRPSSRQVVGVAVNSIHLLLNSFFASPKINSCRAFARRTTLPSVSLSCFKSSSANSSTKHDVSVYEDGEGEGEVAVAMDVEDEYCTPSLDDIEIEIESTGNNSRRIRSKIPMEASLETVWNMLTDYARLAEFIPNLTVSQLLDKGDNFARLFQVGQQELAFGLNFKAKVIVDCYEKDLICLPSSQRRDIEFKMVEGDFQLFEGKWSIEQYMERCEGVELSVGQQQLYTVLTYTVDVKPKIWLPVSLIEGRLCREIKLNLKSIRDVAEKLNRDIYPVL